MDGELILCIVYFFRFVDIPLLHHLCMIRVTVLVYHSFVIIYLQLCTFVRLYAFFALFSIV